MRMSSKPGMWRLGSSAIVIALLALASAVTVVAAGNTPAPSQLFQSPITATPTATVTPTPTPTETVTPTPTPTPTLTSEPGHTRLEIRCDDGEILVGEIGTCTVWIDLDELPRGLAGVEVHLPFAPIGVAEVVDADGNPDNGVQISLHPFSSLFTGGIFVGQNQADNANGTIDFAVSQAGGIPVTDTNGPVQIATIHFRGLQEDCVRIPLVTAILSDRDGYPIALDEFLEDGLCFIPLPQAECKISGTVQLQGRYDHSAAAVEFCSEDGDCYPVVPVPGGSPAGDFELTVDCNERYKGTASMPLYLSAETKPEWKEVTGEECVQAIKLLGGDVIGDNVIDIRDVAYIAYRFGGSDTSADVNGDGAVNILDLTVAAANFERVGPISWPWC